MIHRIATRAFDGQTGMLEWDDVAGTVRGHLAAELETVLAEAERTGTSGGPGPVCETPDPRHDPASFLGVLITSGLVDRVPPAFEAVKARWLPNPELPPGGVF